MNEIELELRVLKFDEQARAYYEFLNRVVLDGAPRIGESIEDRGNLYTVKDVVWLINGPVAAKIYLKQN